MTENSIAYNELNGELQELYLECKQWVSDLDFLDREFVFVRKLLQVAESSMVKQESNDKLPGILLTALKTAEKLEALKQEILSYLHLLENLIVDSNQNLDLALIQTHANLEAKLSQLKLAFGTVKTLVFNLTKQGMNANADLTSIK